MQGEKIPVQIYFTLSALGLWLIASTITFAMGSTAVAYSNFAVGALLIYFGMKCRRSATSLEIWGITALGIWLQFSPLVFWAPEAAAYVNDTFVGAWVIALAITLHPMPGHSLKEEGTIPPGWTYNPSGWPQRLPIAFFAFLCWMIARYLSAYQLGYLETVWDPFFTPGTKGVLESDVSKAFPVSDAGLGALAYTIEFFATCQGGANRWRTAPWLVLVFGILVIPVSLVSTVLIILQPLAVGTWCTLCLVTAVCMLIPIPFAIGEVAATIQFLRKSKEKPFLELLFRGGKCPKEKKDGLSPTMDRPLSVLIESSLSGLTFPWNLNLAAILGIGLMALPSVFGLKGILYDIDPVAGALTAVVSVVSWAEMVRKWRYVNFLFSALILAGAAMAYKSEPGAIIALHVGLAALIALLSIRKGEIKESFDLQMD